VSRARRARALLLAVAATATTGCAGFSDYASDRGRDLVDVIDLKGGRSMGLGLKAEATLYLGAGLGYAVLGDTSEWYGRERLETPADEEETYPGTFLHAVFMGVDWYDGVILQGMFGGGPDPATHNETNILAFNDQAIRNSDEPPMFDRWRFGGEVVLPFVRGGLYLNVGQLADLVIGLTTLDIAGDDGDDGSKEVAEEPSNDSES
jgi:hypothetical protein